VGVWHDARATYPSVPPYHPTVLLKPNLVRQSHQLNDDWEYVITHGSVIRAVTDYVFLSRSRPETVYAVSLGREAGVTTDLFAVTLAFENGAIGQLLYAGNGDPAFPKERLELFTGGTVGVLDDFRLAEVTRGGKSRRARLPRRDKGHAEELRRFTEAVRTGGPMPIPLEELALTSLVTLLAARSIRSGRPEPVDLGEVLGETGAQRPC
jgi:predicted dehydrogenase